MKDDSNIYKVFNYADIPQKHDLWKDSCPSVKNFAECLKQRISSHDDSPYVLGLNGGYGTGKTFFATRFCEKLRRDKYAAIYFSAWEKDYISDPFITFIDVILNYVKSNSKVIKSGSIEAKQNLIKRLGKAVLAATDARVNIGVPFITNAEIGFSGQKFIESWTDSTERSDPMWRQRGN